MALKPHPTREVTLDPHHPDCRYGQSQYLDPERCCYCAALIRHEPNPLDYRIGGPGCYCSAHTEEEA